MFRRKHWLLIVSLGLCACVGVGPRVERPQQTPPLVVKQRTVSEDKADALLRAALDEYKNDTAILDLIEAVRRHSSAPLVAGNDVDVLIDGPQTFAAMKDEIKAARHYIHLETFIFGAGEVGREFSDLLIEKRRQGVEIRVLYDSVGSMDTPASFFQELRDRGIEVREFRPMNPIKNPKIWEIQNRDHRKIVVIDGRVGFAGGINIDNTYSSASTSRPGPERGLDDGWRDTHVRIEGPVVSQLQALFLDNWAKAGDPAQISGAGRAPHSPGKTLVTIVANDSDSDDRALYGTYLAAFTHASRRIWITHAYFAPNEELLKAMQDAAQRSVDVRLIVPAFTDSSLVLKATQSTYTPLLKAGVRIYELKDALLHAKTVVVDGTVSIVGSANLDMRSFLHNDEVNAIIIDRDFGQRMEEIYLRDERASRRVEIERWEKRSLWRRIKEFGVSLFGYWL